MKVTVIVPAFNEEKLLPASLRSIKTAMTAFARRSWETELIVCDNNSTDRTAELAGNEGARVVFEPINQIARARNSGAHAATGDWLVFVDADSHPSEGLMAGVADQIEAGRCLAGGSTVTLDQPHFLAGLVTRGWNVLSRIQKWAPGSFIFCEAAAFREIGGFSNQFFAAEELDLTLKLKRLAKGRGQKVIILHRHPLVTSARKLRLYSLREHLRFLRRTVLGFGRTLKDPKECYTWYDGRR